MGCCRRAKLLAWAVGLLTAAHGLKVEIMVTTRWVNRERRDIQRRALRSCLPQVSAGHTVELLFFMGDLNGTDPQTAQTEQDELGDLVRVGGPDSDPPVPRDATYVLERPCARTYRLAHGTAWLMKNRPDLDYVMYLDDDSFLRLPRLLEHLEEQGSERMAMGFLMQTNLDWSDTHICELCDPCSKCKNQRELVEWCSELFPDMAMGGCSMAITNCQIFNDGQDLAECVAEKRDGIRRLADYFGSRVAPQWMLGMGWVFGRRICQHIARNADWLKVRGAADVTLGFWLAPLEGVQFVNMNEGAFHDHPDTRSTFSRVCTEQSVLVHRLTPSHWAADFDPERCELSCGGGVTSAAQL